MLSIAIVAISCAKEDVPIKPNVADDRVPVSFGSATEVMPVKAGSANVVLTSDLGIYAFGFPSADYVFDVTGPIADAKLKVWGGADNVKYVWDADTYNEDADPKTLFWQTTDEDIFLKFVSYCPFTSAISAPADDAGIRNAYVNADTYELKADFTTQLEDADVVDKEKTFWFSWAQNIYSRPADVTIAQELKFNYKVAKISLVIKGDGKPETPVSLPKGTPYVSSTEVGTVGVVSVHLFNGTISESSADKISVGLVKSYTLNLLTGLTSGGEDQATSDAPITIVPSKYLAGSFNGPMGDDKAATSDYIGAVGYLVPTVADANTESDPLMIGGMVIRIIYNDGTENKIYTAKINSTTLPSATFGADVNLTNGLEAGRNYVYSLKLTQVGVEFTAMVNDWIPAAAIPPIELE